MVRTFLVYGSKSVAMTIAVHAQPGDTFTANNVWDWLGPDAELEHPNGTMGGAFGIVKRRRIAVPTGDIMQSTHPTRKRGMVRVWRFL